MKTADHIKHIESLIDLSSMTNQEKEIIPLLPFSELGMTLGFL